MNADTTRNLRIATADTVPVRTSECATDISGTVHLQTGDWEEATPALSQTAVFRKDDKNKPDPCLLPPEGLVEVIRVLTYGRDKYDRGPKPNWRNGNWERYLSAAMRHCIALLKGEYSDPESGLSHAAHAASNLLFIVELMPKDSNGEEGP